MGGAAASRFRDGSGDGGLPVEGVHGTELRRDEPGAFIDLDRGYFWLAHEDAELHGNDQAL